METICQCCSCENTFNESELKNGDCPHCGSGNWVRGYIDEPEPENLFDDNHNGAVYI